AGTRGIDADISDTNPAVDDEGTPQASGARRWRTAPSVQCPAGTGTAGDPGHQWLEQAMHPGLHPPDTRLVRYDAGPDGVAVGRGTGQRPARGGGVRQVEPWVGRAGRRRAPGAVGGQRRAAGGGRGDQGRMGESGGGDPREGRSTSPATDTGPDPTEPGRQ